MKTCRICEVVKPVEDFYPKTRICRECKCARRRQWAKDHPEQHNAQTREWQRRNPDKVLNTRLKRHYGITLAEFNDMVAAQGGVCVICRQPCATGMRLAVDHCHETGRVHALLCRACNSAIGLLGEDPQRIARAAEYVSLKGQARNALRDAGQAAPPVPSDLDL